MFSDPILRKLSQKYPPPVFEDKSEILFEKLIDNIISQQLSVKAADTIFARFIGLFNKRHPERSEGSSVQKNQREDSSAKPQNDNHKIIFPTPQQVLKIKDEKIRSAGISFQKISYLKSVADAFISGLIDIKRIKKMTDTEVIESLTQIRGVGKWTAEMILIFSLQRPDVFSSGDLGLKRAIEKLYGIKNQKEILKLSESWKPFRSTASWYLWRSLENG